MYTKISIFDIVPRYDTKMRCNLKQNVAESRLKDTVSQDR